MSARYHYFLAPLAFVLLTACGPKPSTPAESAAPAPTAAPAPNVVLTSSLDAPKDGSPVTNHFVVGGWAFASGAAIQEILVFVDGQPVTSAAMGGARPDVSKAYANDPAAAAPGFTTTVDATKLNAGKHEVDVRARLSDGSVRPIGKATISLSK